MIVISGSKLAKSLDGRTGARLPRARERAIENVVELADVPERERAQERPERRWRHHPMPEQQTRGPGAQHVHLIDPVRASKHPVHQ